MGKENRHTSRKIKLMDFIIEVKPIKLNYVGGRIGGSIIINSAKLKSAIGKNVRVIIRTRYQKQYGRNKPSKLRCFDNIL